MEETMAAVCELAERDSIRAYRYGRRVLIVAQGSQPSPGYDVRITQRPERIFPPWYQILQCPRPGIFPQVLVAYKVSLTIDYPVDQEVVTVFHAGGEDKVTIESSGDEHSAYGQALGAGTGKHACPEGSDEAIGFSKELSFEEAFADALAQLPPIEPQHADVLQTVRVCEIGGLFGGFAGFNELYVRVCRTHD
jgi:hypothetical protein